LTEPETDKEIIMANQKDGKELKRKVDTERTTASTLKCGKCTSQPVWKELSDGDLGAYIGNWDILNYMDHRPL